MNDLDAQVYPYVVAALPPDEAADFQAHLAECAQCRAEVKELREVTAQLSQSVATEPPPALRGAVLAAIARTPQPPLTSPQSSSDDVSSASPPGRNREVTAEPTAATVVSLHRSRPSRLPALLAAAAVLAALAMGGWAFQARQEAQQTAQEVTADTQRLTELLSTSDVRLVSGQVTTSGGTGTVVMSPSRKQAVFVSTALPELPEGKIYEAWTTTGRKPVPAGIFSAGEAKTAVSLPAAAIDAQSVAVTVEPAGGSQTPTTKPIFTVQVPRA